MDIGIVGSVVLLIVWGVVTVRFEAPGWWHVLPTLAMFALIYRIVTRRRRPDDTSRS